MMGGGREIINIELHINKTLNFLGNVSDFLLAVRFYLQKAH